jgi:hypothetical protein
MSTTSRSRNSRSVTDLHAITEDSNHAEIFACRVLRYGTAVVDGVWWWNG